MNKPNSKFFKIRSTKFGFFDNSTNNKNPTNQTNSYKRILENPEISQAACF